jgi:hypothetical protein
MKETRPANIPSPSMRVLGSGFIYRLQSGDFARVHKLLVINVRSIEQTVGWT